MNTPGVTDESIQKSQLRRSPFDRGDSLLAPNNLGHSPSVPRPNLLSPPDFPELNRPHMENFLKAPA
jgi:hypothetical protein